MIFIYKFCKKDILIQPPGEPREHHIGEARPENFVLHKRQYDRKGHFCAKCKKVKYEVTGT